MSGRNGFSGVVPGGDPDGKLDEVIGSLGAGPAPPPPSPAHYVEPTPQMLRIGGNIIAAQAIYHPAPFYPPLARMARMQGMVVLEAIIGKDGTVQDLKVVSGQPLLVRAALAAVKSWRYQPTLLNSQAIDVLTEIDVRFSLEE